MNTRLERRAALGSAECRLERMMEIRAVEEAIQSLYNDSHVRGSTHLSNGQEAVSVGLAAATLPTDTFTCTYRGHGAALGLGVAPEEVLGEICGRSNGCGGGLGGSMHLVGVDVGLVPTSAIVGGGIPIAVGVALAAQMRGTSDVGVSVFGDGATNIGAFHESLNLASIWRLPVVFVIENNLYGEYSRINLTTPVEDLAVRAASYAMASEMVDGQDIDIVMDAVSKAVRRAREGGGPSLLEMKTYRYSGHSRSDPATYRAAGELAHWQERDPIRILGDRLAANGFDVDALHQAVSGRVDEAVETVLASPFPAEEEMFRHVMAG